MTTTAIEGGWVITGDPDEPWIEGGHVTVVDGLIESVGRGSAPGGADRTIDAGGMLVSPGFVNGHTHLCMSLGRSLGTGRLVAGMAIGRATAADGKVRAGGLRAGRHAGRA